MVIAHRAEQYCAYRSRRCRTRWSHSAVAPISDLIQQFPDCAHTHLQDQILLPGLVNAHGHAAMSLMRGVGAGLALQEWLQEAIWPLRQNTWTPKRWLWGTELALAEMLLSGTTCFADMYFFPETVARVAHQTGMRCQITAPIINFATSWSRDADDALHKTMALYDEYRHHPLIRVAFGPHSAYSLERKHLNQIAMYADELEAAVQIHLHETQREVGKPTNNLGHGHVELLRDTGLLGPRLQTVHMTELTAAEIDMVAAAKASRALPNLEHATGQRHLSSGRTAGSGYRRPWYRRCRIK